MQTRLTRTIAAALAAGGLLLGLGGTAGASDSQLTHEDDSPALHVDLGHHGGGVHMPAMGIDF